MARWLSKASALAWHLFNRQQQVIENLKEEKSVAKIVHCGPLPLHIALVGALRAHARDVE